MECLRADRRRATSPPPPGACVSGGIAPTSTSSARQDPHRKQLQFPSQDRGSDGAPEWVRRALECDREHRGFRRRRNTFGAGLGTRRSAGPPVGCTDSRFELPLPARGPVASSPISDSGRPCSWLDIFSWFYRLARAHRHATIVTFILGLIVLETALYETIDVPTGRFHP